LVHRYKYYYFIRRGRSRTVGCGSDSAGSALDIGAGDPSPTVIANALRIGHHIVECPQ